MAWNLVSWWGKWTSVGWTGNWSWAFVGWTGNWSWAFVGWAGNWSRAFVGWAGNWNCVGWRRSWTFVSWIRRRWNVGLRGALVRVLGTGSATGCIWTGLLSLGWCNLKPDQVRDINLYGDANVLAILGVVCVSLPWPPLQTGRQRECWLSWR